MFKFKKEQTMKLSEYFELKSPKYCTLQIIPHSSNRNYDTEIMEKWNFENWGIKYWSKTPEFIEYVNNNKGE
ncbi:hypothetical protein [Clostridium sp. ZS6]|uniref:hypothetical protein n=1 Tax=Clostridium sp. ZS6 TaxID=2949987 RepID=UPI00207B02AF|nr:hypothetical protein [Clostridium sp. ZS6]